MASVSIPRLRRQEQKLEAKLASVRQKIAELEKASKERQQRKADVEARRSEVRAHNLKVRKAESISADKQEKRRIASEVKSVVSIVAEAASHYYGTKISAGAMINSLGHTAKIRAARFAAIRLAASSGFTPTAIGEVFAQTKEWVRTSIKAPLSIDANAIIALATNTRPSVISDANANE
jgi:hypothetical protein